MGAKRPWLSWAAQAAGCLPASVRRPSWGSPGSSPWLGAGSSESWAAAQRERKGLIYGSDCTHDRPGTKQGLTLSPATSLRPAVLVAQPHLPGPSVGTLGICRLSESRLCAHGSLGPPTLAPGPVGRANRATGPLANPQTLHPVKPNPWLVSSLLCSRIRHWGSFHPSPT